MHLREKSDLKCLLDLLNNEDHYYLDLTRGGEGHRASGAASGCITGKSLPLRPNTLEKSLPRFPWQLELLAEAFCNILSLLATCRMGLIFALQTLELVTWSSL